MPDDEKENTLLNSFLRNAGAGSLLGLGAFSATELARIFKDITEDKSYNADYLEIERKEIDPEKIKDSESGDNTVKTANDDSMFDEAAKYSGFLGSSMVTYALLQNLRKKYEKDQVKNELKEKQKEYYQNKLVLDQLKNQYPKKEKSFYKASAFGDDEDDGPNIISQVGGVGITGLLLTALASAKLAPRVMDNYFGKPQAPDPGKYKNQSPQLVVKNPESSVSDADDNNKQEKKEDPVDTFLKSSSCDIKLKEHLVRTAAALEKKANRSTGIDKIVNAVGNNKSNEIFEIYNTGGADLVFSSYKNEDKPSAQKKSAAFTKVASDPVFAGLVLPYSIAEITDSSPVIASMGAWDCPGMEKMAYMYTAYALDNIKQNEFGDIIGKINTDLVKSASVEFLNYQPYHVSAVCDDFINNEDSLQQLLT